MNRTKAMLKQKSTAYWKAPIARRTN